MSDWPSVNRFCKKFWGLMTKVGKNRDTVSMEPGSRPFCGSRSVSTDTFLGVAGRKDTFSYTSDTLCVSSDTETVSLSMSPSQNFCVGNNLV